MSHNAGHDPGGAGGHAPGPNNQRVPAPPNHQHIPAQPSNQPVPAVAVNQQWLGEFMGSFVGNLARQGLTTDLPQPSAATLPYHIHNFQHIQNVNHHHLHQPAPAYPQQQQQQQLWPAATVTQQQQQQQEQQRFTNPSSTGKRKRKTNNETIEEFEFVPLTEEEANALVSSPNGPQYGPDLFNRKGFGEFSRHKFLGVPGIDDSVYPVTTIGDEYFYNYDSGCWSRRAYPVKQMSFAEPDLARKPYYPVPIFKNVHHAVMAVNLMAEVIKFANLAQLESLGLSKTDQMRIEKTMLKRHKKHSPLPNNRDWRSESMSTLILGSYDSETGLITCLMCLQEGNCKTRHATIGRNQNTSFPHHFGKCSFCLNASDGKNGFKNIGYLISKCLVEGSKIVEEYHLPQMLGRVGGDHIMSDTLFDIESYLHDDWTPKIPIDNQGLQKLYLELKSDAEYHFKDVKFVITNLDGQVVIGTVHDLVKNHDCKLFCSFRGSTNSLSAYEEVSKHVRNESLNFWHRNQLEIESYDGTKFVYTSDPEQGRMVMTVIKGRVKYTFLVDGRRIANVIVEDTTTKDPQTTRRRRDDDSASEYSSDAKDDPDSDDDGDKSDDDDDDDENDDEKWGEVLRFMILLEESMNVFKLTDGPGWFCGMVEQATQSYLFDSINDFDKLCFSGTYHPPGAKDKMDWKKRDAIAALGIFAVPTVRKSAAGFRSIGKIPVDLQDIAVKTSPRKDLNVLSASLTPEEEEEEDDDNDVGGDDVPYELFAEITGIADDLAHQQKTEGDDDDEEEDDDDDEDEDDEYEDDDEQINLRG